MIDKTTNQWDKLYTNYYRTYWDRASLFELQGFMNKETFKEVYSQYYLEQKMGEIPKGSLVNYIVKAQTMILHVGKTSDKGKGEAAALGLTARTSNSLYVHFRHCLEEARRIQASTQDKDEYDALTKWLNDYSYLVNWESFKRHISDAVRACNEICEFGGYTPT